MKTYEQGNENIGDYLIKILEKETKNKVFTLRFLNEMNDENELDTLIVFEDKTVLRAMIFVDTVDGKWAARIRGNFI